LVFSELSNWKQVVPAADSSLTQACFDSKALPSLLAGIPKLPHQDEVNRGVTWKSPGQPCVSRPRPRILRWTQLTLQSARISGRLVSISLSGRELLAPSWTCWR